MFRSSNPFFSYAMAKEIFIINLCALFLCSGQLQAQYWNSLEHDKGVCSVDSLVIINPQYQSLLDTIDYYWSMCEISKYPCYAMIEFADTNHLKVHVKQVVEVSPLVVACYMNKIYGIICYGKLQYFFVAPFDYLIDKESFQKTASTFTPSYFSTQTYIDLITQNEFLFQKLDKKSLSTHTVSPFDFEERIEEVYDNLRLDIYFLENDIICKELERCIRVNSIPNSTR